MAQPKKKNNKGHILLRYGILVILFVGIGIGVAVKLFNTTVIEAAAWNERAYQELSKVTKIYPERGNLLASDGSILACNLRVYDVLLDLRHSKIQRFSVLPQKEIDSLADTLDVLFPRSKRLHAHPDSFAKYSWRTKLKREFEKAPDKRSRSLRIVQKGTLEQYEQIRQLPFLKRWAKTVNTPLYKTARTRRIYPYGKMAFRSIGRVNENRETKEIHGYSGLEMFLDTLLYGQTGEAKKVPLTNGFTNWVDKPAKRGYDIRTTIDIDLQDLLEEELLKVCMESSAEWGTAVLMEVATGEIKAISNIELLDDGTYGEALNRAGLPFEPGSVMKPISLMIAFEDGLVHSVNDRVDCSPFMRTSDPHGSGMKTMKQVIEQSSNTGIARVIFRKYAHDPASWHDRLAGLGFFEPLRSGIGGERLPNIRKLVDKDSRGNNITMTARHLDLARQAYGYNTELPPLFTLSVYNAIANDGKYVRPHLVKSLIGEDGRDSVMPIEYIRDKICTPETAAKVRECIREVVWGEHGTARLVRDDRVEIAGKTGTAYPVEKGSYNTAKRRYAFAGFFPYSAPKYSCISLVLARGGTSANRTSGQVVKNMALKMYSRGMLGNSSDYAEERHTDTPVLSGSTHKESASLARAAGVSSVKRLQARDDAPEAVMPNLTGFDAPSAVRLLEKRGINARISGAGYVYSQSIPPGTQLKRGSTVKLSLRI